jgi:hypothetical protein
MSIVQGIKSSMSTVIIPSILPQNILKHVYIS